MLAAFSSHSDTMQGRAFMKNTGQGASSGIRAAGGVPLAQMGGGGAGPLRPPVSPPARPPSALGAYARSADEPTRTLPDRNITDTTVEDAYIQFIFYCNPYLSGNIDTTELRRGFNSMPKTDGRTFEPFVLYQLICKLEAREIETWAQLVMEMGVKPPDVQSGQSAQKVQQYAVRLKRWLHAHHIDAFFQYCLGKNHSYFTDIPIELNEHTIRDGVPPEEDLALRALVPKLRPKRGRRPNDDADGSPNAKRVLRATSLTADEQLSSAMPMGSYPQSAFPWDRHSNSTDAWLRSSATRDIAPQSDAQQPPHTQSHVNQPVPSIEGPGLSFSFDDADGEGDGEGDVDPGPIPQSAIAPRGSLSAFPRPTPPPASAHPSTSAAHRSRKRHGPAVSAAWTPDESGGRSRPRGRPPAQRTTHDGLFGSFPAKANGSGSTLTPATPATPQVQGVAYAQPPAPTPPGGASSSAAAARNKPSKLQLQVPQHEGGPVRLATPPAPAGSGGIAGSGGVGHLPRPTLGRSRGSHLRNSSRSSAEFFTRDRERELQRERERDESEIPDEYILDTEDDPVDWKRRAIGLARKVKELELELRAVRRRVMEAVM